jgi:mitochondrial import inner membrane translocase subunit TIM50
MLESSLQPENCVPIKPWKLENDDTRLLDLIPFLECKPWFFFVIFIFWHQAFPQFNLLTLFNCQSINVVDVAMARPSDIRTVLASYQGCDIATEFIERSKEHKR